MLKKKIVFLILPDVQILDLGGPLQTFYEANVYGANYQIELCSLKPNEKSEQYLQFINLKHFSEIKLNNDDMILIPGFNGSYLSKDELAKFDPAIFDWLRLANTNGATICSICNAAFVLAYAGLLDGKKCTTHWYRFEQLAKEYPNVNVMTNRLFVKDGNIYSSAGITAGIDLALSLIEDDYGPVFTAKIAKELVVYMRRDSQHSQLSTYLDYRTHLNSSIHKVQDYIINHPSHKVKLDSLAEIAGMSSRNLTRIFKKETGLTINEFTNKIRLELAKDLMNNPDLTIENIARECGFEDPRQFRRLWKLQSGVSPSDSRRLLMVSNL
ncbi:MAG: helix-turn-helix domain-containing protein [Calditrichaeota bacterium]|nr:helix-turn-helix domain-containing protein [Calditrichota bacterium]